MLEPRLPFRVGTVATRAQLPHARVLADAVAAHHNGLELHVLVIDDVDGPAPSTAEPLVLLRPDDLGFPLDHWHRLAMVYPEGELVRGIEPWLLRHLANGTAAVFLDPDTDLHGPLDRLVELAHEHGIVLVPRRLGPVPADGAQPAEAELLALGIFDLGLVAVGPGGGPAIDAWCTRVTDGDALRDARWADQLPALAAHHVLRDPAYGIAYWNLDERSLAPAPGGWTVDGAPLHSAHLAGFRLDQPHLVTSHLTDNPRVVRSAYPAVAGLLDRYAARLRAAGGDEPAPMYGYERLLDGTPIDHRMRAVFGAALDAAVAAGSPLPPDPFVPGAAEALLDWLAEPDPARPWRGVSRYLYALWEERPDVQAAFPDLTGPDADGFLIWVLSDGRQQTAIPDRLLPAQSVSVIADAPVTLEPELLPGINVAGYFRAEFGVAQAARLLLSALDEAAIPHRTITYAATGSRQEHPFDDRGAGDAAYDTNIVCVNADHVRHFARDVGEEFFRGRYTIGMWHWEVEEFPTWMHGGLEFVDEVWTASDFSREAIQRATDKPVHTFPLPVVSLDVPAELDRAQLGLPDGFVFLFCFDYFSVAERKNPTGLVEAFCRAFAPGEGPQLVLKTVNGDQRPVDRERLLYAVRDRPDVHLIEGYLSAEETAALMARSDCYISLHRTEGFGLTLAEAMSLGKPVIATAYSGNLGFMTAENSYLVPYDLVPIPVGSGPYPPTARWAEPDSAAAARLMRHVVDHPEEAAARGALAQREMLELHGPEARARFVAARLDEIRRSRAPRPAVADEAEAEVASGGPRQRLRGRVRRGLARALGPYAVPQAGVDEAVAAAMSGADEQARQREAELARGLQSLSAELQQSEARARAYAAQLALLPDAARVDARLDLHMADLTRLADEMAGLAGDVTGVDYMADSRLLVTTDEEGREALGYRHLAGETAYTSVEGVFRGSAEVIRDRQRVYVDLLATSKPVLDVGCGSGELLALLAEAGVPATGVDVDASAVVACRRRGLDVVEREAVAYLTSADPGSLGAVVATHLVEHLSDTALHGLLEAAYAALRPGGILLAETINPHSLRALKTFYADLSRQKPVFPETALVLCRQYGFDEAWIVFPHGTGKLEDDRAQQAEYAVVARKTAGTHPPPHVPTSAADNGVSAISAADVGRGRV